MLREFEDQENLMAELDEQVFFLFFIFFPNWICKEKQLQNRPPWSYSIKIKKINMVNQISTNTSHKIVMLELCIFFDRAHTEKMFFRLEFQFPIISIHY
jgi:hypothetical protein